MKNSFSWGKTYEGNIILSHLPGTLKVFWWLAYPFLFHFVRRRPTCMFRQKQRFTWILASKMLASFSRTISTVLLLLVYRCWVKFCTEKLKNARRKLLKLRNKHSVFVPNAAIFYPGKKFWSCAKATSARLAINKNNAINCNFCQASSKHLITLEPKPYLFFSKSLSKI